VDEIRRQEPQVVERLRHFPAVALLGPRQAGKTTLALTIGDSLEEGAVYLDLELPSVRAKLSDPELYLARHQDKLVILDEPHRLPGIFQTLRGLIEQRRRMRRRP
jgi:predicted AAA+ superfamily ATPase